MHMHSMHAGGEEERGEMRIDETEKRGAANLPKRMHAYHTSAESEGHCLSHSGRCRRHLSITCCTTSIIHRILVKHYSMRVIRTSTITPDDVGGMLPGPVGSAVSIRLAYAVICFSTEVSIAWRITCNII